ncbi:MAG TPA: hypothetical protein VK541_11320 [Pedobacter sp.]|uniref:hypothetical protein n=1 Tax=Pedobacter sp. TaxID=1411316 RepID=UPI002C59B844|nr:hypothetical protein [Pedobacter sp.]HMI03065.1 hypothetical protein [Pedobacter sp.]
MKFKYYKNPDKRQYFAFNEQFGMIIYTEKNGFYSISTGVDQELCNDIPSFGEELEKELFIELVAPFEVRLKAATDLLKQQMSDDLYERHQEYLRQKEQPYH